MNNFIKHCMKIGLLLIAFASCNVSPQLSKTLSFDAIKTELNKSVAEKGFISLDTLLVFFDKGKISPKVQDVLSKIQITSPEIIVKPQEFSLKGIAKVGTVAISLELVLQKTTGSPQARLGIGLPTGAHVSDLFPDLKELDVVKFDFLQFMISSYDYIDSVTKINIKTGVTFIAEINADDLFEIIRAKVAKNTSQDEFKKSVSKFFGTEKLAIRGYANIPFDLKGIIFYIEILTQFSLDFEASKKKNGEPAFKKPFIQKLTSSSIKAEVHLGKNMSIAISAGVFAQLRTQPKPLEFRAGGDISQSGFELTGMMLGAYDPAFGLNFLAFGTFDPNLPPMALALYWDYEIAAATMLSMGLPLPSGVKLSGAVGLGQVPYLTTGSGVIDVTVKSAGISELVVSGNVDKIDLSHFIKMLADIDKKKNLEIGKDIPVIVFSELHLLVAPFATEVFGISYDAGVQAGAKMQIGKFTGSGELIIGLTPKAPRFMAKVTMTPFEIKTKKGNIIFGIKGFKSENPLFSIDLAVGRPLSEQGIIIDGSLLVPPLAYEGSLNFNLAGTQMSGSSVGSFFNGKFTASCDLILDFDHPDRFDFTCSLHNDLTPWLIENMKAGMEQAKADAEKRLAVYKKQIEDIQSGLKNKSATEVARVDAHIAELKTELKTYTLKPAAGLKPAVANNIRVFNHTQESMYVRIYIVDKKTKESVSATDIVAVPSLTINQIKRPPLAVTKFERFDRDMLISRNINDLKDKLTGDEYVNLLKQHVGQSIIRVHVTMKDGELKTYAGVQWDVGPQTKVVDLGTELAAFEAYRNAILNPGTKAAQQSLEFIKNLAKVPEAFIELADKIVEGLTKTMNLLVLHDAKIHAEGEELKKGKLSEMMLKFDINTPKGKVYPFDLDLEIDLLHPLKFFTSLSMQIERTILQIKDDGTVVGAPSAIEEF